MRSVLRMILCIALAASLFSCNRSSKKVDITGKWRIVQFQNNLEMIVGKWNAVSLQNPQLDSFFTSAQHYIDTVGKGHDAATNMQIYGVANMDSLRLVLQKQYDSSKQMMYQPVASTSFWFREDGVAVLSFHGSVDSSRWSIDSVGDMILDDMNDATSGDKVNLEIISVSDTAMKLRFRENNAYSIVTFHPEGERAMQQQQIPDSYFNFRKDSVVVLSFNGALDSNWWYMDNDSVITVGNVATRQAGTQFQWSVLSVSDTSMKLRIVENSSISTFSFHREGK